MALSDLAVYSDYAYSSFTEVLDQQIDLFNSASAGTILLSSMANRGDFSETALFAKISGLVRRRNAYGTGTVAKVALSNIADVSVKVAAGTPPVDISPSMFTWIQQQPAIAGAAMGQQLAVEYLADMLNMGLGAANAGLQNVGASVTHDVTANAAPDDKLSFVNLNDTTRLYGDSASSLLAWVMHSQPLFDLYGGALTNAETLFTYGTVNVKRDPFGRLLIATDSPYLVDGTTYSTLGLQAGAIIIEQNRDFFANESTTNGTENIERTYQAEWSYNLALKGMAWDKTNGGKSPTTAALMAGTNWDKVYTSVKDCAGVVCLSH